MKPTLSRRQESVQFQQPRHSDERHCSPPVPVAAPWQDEPHRSHWLHDSLTARRKRTPGDYAQQSTQGAHVTTPPAALVSVQQDQDEKNRQNQTAALPGMSFQICTAPDIVAEECVRGIGYVFRQLLDGGILGLGQGRRAFLDSPLEGRQQAGRRGSVQQHQRVEHAGPVGAQQGQDQGTHQQAILG